MLETLSYTLKAIVPILLIILLGYIVRRIGHWSDDFYKQLNQLCFRLFLPVQLFCNVYAIDDLSTMNWCVIGYLFCGILACALVGVLAAKALVPKRLQKGVIVQASFRSNQAVLGLPLANSLGGDAAMGFAALSTSVSVPLFNVLAVLVLTLYGSDEGHKPTAKEVAGRVARNPLIIGAMSGVIVVLIRQLIPTIDGVPVFTIRNQLPIIYDTINRLSVVSSPVMLFVLGTRLDLTAVGSILPQLTLGVTLRLIVSPLLVIGTAVLFRETLNLTPTELPSLITITSTPVAVSSAVMVQELGGDDQLASQMVVWTTILSAITIFCIVYILRLSGLL
ncbi:MAG: AEC family transporter [Oscillibacter sp.]|nr:AEC family transporter [Oscillibacter sp.]